MDQNDAQVLTRNEEGVPMNENTREITCTCCWDKVKKFFKGLTVEPALLLFFLGYGMENVYITNLWIEKICLFQFNYSKTVCDNLNTGKYPTAQDNVQKMTSEYNLYTGILEYLPAVFVVLLLGTWSDKRGRRLPIIIPLLGYFLTALGVTVVSYWWTLSPIYLLLTYIPVSLTGGLIGIYAGIYPYLAAVTSGRARTSSISFMGVVVIISATVGTALGLVIFKRLGYVAVFGIQAILTGVAIIYSILRLEDRPEGHREINEAPNEGVLHVLSPSYVKQTVLVAFKKRSGGKRGDILGHIIIMMIVVFISVSYKYNFLYTRKKFQWDNADFSIYQMVDIPITSIGLLFILPILSYYWKVEDCILGFMGGVSLLLSNVIKGTAPEPWVMFLASVVGMCIYQVTAATRGAVSKLVDRNEVGAVFAVLGASEALIPMAAAPVYFKLYNATLNIFPGTVFIFVAVLSLIICCIYVWIMTKKRPLQTQENDTDIPTRNEIAA